MAGEEKSNLWKNSPLFSPRIATDSIFSFLNIYPLKFYLNFPLLFFFFLVMTWQLQYFHFLHSLYFFFLWFEMLLELDSRFLWVFCFLVCILFYFILVHLSLHVPSCSAQSLSHVWFFASPWTCQVPLSMGILLARILKQVAISHSRGSSRPRDQALASWVSCIGRQILYHCTTWKALIYHCHFFKVFFTSNSAHLHCWLFFKKRRHFYLPIFPNKLYVSLSWERNLSFQLKMQ